MLIFKSSLNYHVYWDTMYIFSAGISSLVIPNPTVHLLTDLSNISKIEGDQSYYPGLPEPFIHQDGGGDYHEMSTGLPERCIQ